MVMAGESGWFTLDSSFPVSQWLVFLPEFYFKCPFPKKHGENLLIHIVGLIDTCNSSPIVPEYYFT
jgi:hypothetical protein